MDIDECNYLWFNLLFYTRRLPTKQGENYDSKSNSKDKNQNIYATYCPYCVKAKTLLKEQGLNFEEIDVTDDTQMRIKLVEITKGHKTVPQIMIDDKPIGGYDDLHQLTLSKQLNSLVY